jgi:hypothetical protein
MAKRGDPIYASDGTYLGASCAEVALRVGLTRMGVSQRLKQRDGWREFGTPGRIMRRNTPITDAAGNHLGYKLVEIAEKTGRSIGYISTHITQQGGRRVYDPD